jgi:hypothetical protein
MSFKPYTGSFDALTGSIFASWFALGANGPMAHAVGYAEMADRPWSLFYRWMCPAGGRAYVGAAIREELSALSEDFGEMFFNFMFGLNNHLICTDEPFLPEAPAFIRTNGNPLVDATMRWLVESSPDFFDLDWERELCLRRTYGVTLPAEKFDQTYRRCINQQSSSPEAPFGRWWNLVTDIGHAERSANQFAQSWVKAERDHLRERSTISYSRFSEFYDSFDLPLLPTKPNGKLWSV